MTEGLFIRCLNPRENVTHSGSTSIYQGLPYPDPGDFAGRMHLLVKATSTQASRS
jgi:hypothetical protein